MAIRQTSAELDATNPTGMTTDQLLKAGYKLGTTTAYDGESGWFEIPWWVDPSGNAIKVSPQQIATNDKTYQAQVRAEEEKAGNFRYVGIGGDEESGQGPTDYVKVPKASPDYKTPESIAKHAVFQDVNAFSGGQLGKIVDAINSGEYKITDDKSKMITPYGSYSLQSLGNGLYDIPIGARAGSYNVAIGINDKGKAIFDKNFLDNSAVRYQGGSAGGVLGNFVRDVGPVGNIALAVATGGTSIPTQIAAQTAYNMVGGADFEDALAKGALTTGISQGIGSLTGGSNLGSMNPEDYAGLGGGLGGGESAIYAGAGEGAFPGASAGTVASDFATSNAGIAGLAGADDIMTSIGGVGQMGGSLPTTEFPLGAGVSDLSTLGESTTGIYPGEGVPSGVPAWDNAYVSAGGTFNPAYVAADDVAAQQAAANAVAPEGAGAGVADLAGTTAGAGMAGAGLTTKELLKYAGLASLAAGVLGGGQSAGGGGGVDQTPVGVGLSPDYKPYRYQPYAEGGITALAEGGYNLGGYSDGGRLLRGPGDGVSDDIPATIGGKQPARLADGEFVIPARIVSEIGNGSTDAGARKLYEMMDRVQSARRKTMGKKKFAKDTNADKYLPV